MRDGALAPGMAPTGYLNERNMDRKCHLTVDQDRAPIVKTMFERVAYEKWSGRKVFHWLKFELNFMTRGNKNLSLSNIYIILQNSFYYGNFEYPQGSGNWYQGKHKPIISKELFDLVQGQLKRDQIMRENKEFAFTKLITCGLCGSGVTAEEKYKKLRNGSVRKYIYYGCTRSRDLHCKCGYLREEELVSQLIRIIDELDVNEIGLKKQFQDEVDRYNRFQKTVLNMNGNEKEINKDQEFNIKTYARYVLKEGSIIEKRELLSCLKSKLIMKNKELSLTK